MPTVAAPFERFGSEHLAALAATALVAAGLVAVARRGPRASLVVRAGLTLAIAAGVAAYVALLAQRGSLSVWALLPLHVCDMLLLVATAALLTRSEAAAEVLFYWAGAGTLLALVTPDVRRGWPDPWFVVFFGFHGLVVVAAAVTTFGQRRWPRRGSSLRVFAWTGVYAVVVALVNVAAGTNYMYLRRKPHGATLLDAFGPWPWYVVAGAVLALVLFVLLELAFTRWARPAAPNAARPDSAPPPRRTP